MVRGGWACPCPRSSRFSLGIVRLVESGVKLSCRITKARKLQNPCLRVLVCLRDGLTVDSTGRTLAGRINRLRVAGRSQGE